MRSLCPRGFRLILQKQFVPSAQTLLTIDRQSNCNSNAAKFLAILLTSPISCTETRALNVTGQRPSWFLLITVLLAVTKNGVAGGGEEEEVSKRRWLQRPRSIKPEKIFCTAIIIVNSCFTVYVAIPGNDRILLERW